MKRLLGSLFLCVWFLVPFSSAQSDNFRAAARYYSAKKAYEQRAYGEAVQYLNDSRSFLKNASNQRIQHLLILSLYKSVRYREAQKEAARFFDLYDRKEQPVGFDKDVDKVTDDEVREITMLIDEIDKHVASRTEDQTAFAAWGPRLRNETINEINRILSEAINLCTANGVHYEKETRGTLEHRWRHDLLTRLSHRGVDLYQIDWRDELNVVTSWAGDSRKGVSQSPWARAGTFTFSSKEAEGFSITWRSLALYNADRDRGASPNSPADGYSSGARVGTLSGKGRSDRALIFGEYTDSDGPRILALFKRLQVIDSGTIDNFRQIVVPPLN